MKNFWKKLPSPFTVLAPMDDVTDVVFRDIIASIAPPDVFFTEFVSAQGLCSVGKEKVMHKLRYTENQRPIVAQIWGSSPEYMTQAAELVQNLGFEGIDINMGCPDRNVMKMNAGASLIKNENLAKELIHAVKSGAPNIPLSVKTRIDADPLVTEEWISFLLRQDISALTLHARTAKELSKVSARWEEIANAVQLRNTISPTTVIVGNGDVKSYSEALQKTKDFGVDGVMIGRGIFANPWVFDTGQTPVEHTTQEYLDLLLKHLALYEETWKNDRSFEVMKKFFKVYIKNFRGADELRQRLMECKEYRHARRIISDFDVPTRGKTADAVRATVSI